MKWSAVNEERLFESLTLLQPSRAIMVTTLNDDGSLNVAPFGWAMPVSFLPPILGLALLNYPKKQHSLVNIEREREFVLNLPSLDIAETIVKSSYRLWPEGRNKFEVLGLTRKPSLKIRTPGFAEARAQLECVVSDITAPGGDHKLVIATVVAATYNSELYGPNLLLKLDKAKPALHMEQWAQSNSQVHMFLDPLGALVIDVPYEIPGPAQDSPRLEEGEKG